MGGGASSAKKLPSVHVTHGTSYKPGSYWRRLARCFRVNFPQSGVTADDVSCALVFLRVGNLVNREDGSVRRYTDKELAYFNETLDSSRRKITKIVKAVVKILVHNQGPILSRHATHQPGNDKTQNSNHHNNSKNSEQAKQTQKGHADAQKPSYNNQKKRNEEGRPALSRHVSFLASLSDEEVEEEEGKRAGEDDDDDDDARSAEEGGGRGELTAHNESMLICLLKALVGNHTWSLNGLDQEMYDFVRQQAATKLRQICEEGEQKVYPHYRNMFLDLPVPKRRSHRLDDINVMPIVALQDVFRSHAVGSLQPHPYEAMVFFEFLAKIIDPYFQAKAEALAKQTNGQWKPAPPKNSTRMAAKLADDHANEREPKAAANIDMSRCALTFDEAADLKKAFLKCGSSADMQILRAKNHFLPSFNAAEESFGYRAVLTNVLLKLPVSWSALLDEAPNNQFLPRIFQIGDIVVTGRHPKSGLPTHGKISDYRLGSVFVLGLNGGPDVGRGPSWVRVDDLVEMNREKLDAGLAEWQRGHVNLSLKNIPNLLTLVTRLQFTLFCNASFLNAKATFIVEIQLILTEYLNMRKKSHLWYKLHRTPAIKDLVADFHAYAGIHRESSFLVQALNTGHKRLLNTFSGFKALPKAQVAGRCDDQGRTVLHLVAAQSDGRFDKLLNRAACLDHLSVCELNWYNESPYDTAVSCGNANAEKVLRVWVQRAVLKVLYDSTNGKKWGNNYGWDMMERKAWNITGFSRERDFQYIWHGLKFSKQTNRITEIRLPSNKLNGCIPWQLGLLQELETLHLESNRLTGSVPTVLGRLTALKDLNLASNALEGPFPADVLVNLKRLHSLNIESNRFSGWIPKEFGTLTELSVLNLASNRIAGFLPTQLGRLTKLVSLNLSHNQLTGKVPSQLGGLTNLEAIDLSSNRSLNVPPVPGKDKHFAEYRGKECNLFVKRLR